MVAMLSHHTVWAAIDALAKRRGLSVSALAKMAGLDATAFNPSKRVSRDGRERWPSTESIAKILEATEEDFDSFLSGSGGYSQYGTGHVVPLLGLARAGAGGFFDSAGFPAGQGWDEVKLPGGGDNGTYALEVNGDSMVPLYRHGDIVVVSPNESVRRGDRVAVRTRDGEVMVKVLERQTARTIELHSINPAYPPRILKTSEVDWMARIIWVSQ